MTWEDLLWWGTEDWTEIQQKIDEHEQRGTYTSPSRDRLFAALDSVNYDAVKVVFVGQDPYPQSKYATGVAFSIPRELQTWPVTLCSIIQEYCRDLNYTTPTNGSLDRWVEQGVLLWNAIPSYIPEYTIDGLKINKCSRWPWHGLTQEIIQSLSAKAHGVVFVFLGGVAREYMQYVNDSANPVIVTSHPSPRGSLSSRHPFKHSRLFSTVNDRLRRLDYEPIDWLLEGSRMVVNEVER